MTKALRGSILFSVERRHILPCQDQGHGPIKVLGIEAGVNITVGLPVVRTSVDHGSGYDIAGKGQADATSMLYAIKAALEML